MSPQFKASAKSWALVLMSIAALLGLGAALLSRYRSPQIELATGSYLAPARAVPDFSLIDHHGAPFGPHNLDGHWSLMFFGYTNCPDFCPTTLVTLAAMEKKLQAQRAIQPQVVFVSVDAKRDTPEQLAKYVPYFDPAFIGVTARRSTDDRSPGAQAGRRRGARAERRRRLQRRSLGRDFRGRSGGQDRRDPHRALYRGHACRRISIASWPSTDERSDPRAPVRLASVRSAASRPVAPDARGHPRARTVVPQPPDPRLPRTVRRRHERCRRDRSLPLRELQRVLHARLAKRRAADRRGCGRHRLAGRRPGERMRRNRGRFAAAGEGPALQPDGAAWRAKRGPRASPAGRSRRSISRRSTITASTCRLAGACSIRSMCPGACSA